MSADTIEILGRQSSHYTRVARIFAIELGVPYRFVPIFELMSRDPETFAGNPALTLPILRAGGEVVFGSTNICRVLARRASKPARIVWPEAADTPLLMNAHEVLAHAMGAQVQVVVHEIVERRPPDGASQKRRESLVRSLAWLDAHLDAILAAMPDRDLSLFEASLFCLASHLPFRNPIDLSEMPRLTDFERRFGERPSARETPYRFDAP